METQKYVASASGASLVVLERDQIRVVDLDGRSEWTIGRLTPDRSTVPDISFESAIVSRKHGCLKHVYDEWYYVDDPGNLNGTYLNGVKIERAPKGARKPKPLKSGDVLRIDSPDLNCACADGVLMLFTTQAPKGEWTVFPLSGAGRVIIGRSAACDLIEPLPYISARHAKITCLGDRYYLSDCGSKAGTFLNGKSVGKSELLREKDLIAIGDCNIFFLGDRLLFPPIAGAIGLRRVKKDSR